MTIINPYLTFDGNCEEAFNFYKSVFGGEFSSLNRYSELPEKDSSKKMPQELKNKIMHIAIPIGKCLLMGCDNGGEWKIELIKGNNFAISIQVDSKEELDRVFNSLSDNGNISMPISLTFWNAYFAIVDDKFGISWMISYEIK